VETFAKLHHILQPELEKTFFPKGYGTRDPKKSKYCIDTETRLAVGLRFFAGGSPFDIQLVNGIGETSVYDSVWGVVDAINNTEALAIKFPNHDQQKEIAAGFEELSGCDFPNVIGCIDGLLVWTNKPSLAWCRLIKCGEAKFKCARKDKFGVNLQAICDNKLRFTYIDMQWPGSTSDYLAWVTSGLCNRLETEEDLLIDGATLVGDNAYVKKSYMAVPLKGKVTGHEDAYNFYLSQLRINIERAFGALVHRFPILRAPLLFPIVKVAPMVEALCRLHNFLINEQDDLKGVDIEKANESHLEKITKFSNICSGSKDSVVELDEEGIPTDLLGGGDHTSDYNDRRAETEFTPMDAMIKHCFVGLYERPTVF